MSNVAITGSGKGDYIVYVNGVEVASGEDFAADGEEVIWAALAEVGLQFDRPFDAWADRVTDLLQPRPSLLPEAGPLNNSDYRTMRIASGGAAQTFTYRRFNHVGAEVDSAEMTPTEARQFAADLLAAANEAEAGMPSNPFSAAPSGKKTHRVPGKKVP